MIRLYINSPLLKEKEVILTETQHNYIQNVMRLKKGKMILVFNGVEGEWKARIEETLKKSTTLVLMAQTRPQVLEKDLWLLFSPLKPKRQEFLVEKATELGVSRLCPLRLERTSLPKVNIDKMHAHAQEAAEQCGRLTLPELMPLTPFPSLLKAWPEERTLVFGDETLTSPSLGSLSFDPQKPYAFLVGPEGGFTRQELSLLKALPHAQGVTLNSHILRAETAALVGLSYIALMLHGEHTS
jgi:16S rRNA (uracil1498-N3)-methyltransferase